MAKYRIMPVVVEALQWTGSNMSEIKSFIGESLLGYKPLFETDWEVGLGAMRAELSIKTIDSVVKVVNGDYIIKGVQGEFYPCKPDIFELTYELAE
ncbi:hypothetical protein CYV26_02045 [Carnobacterium maltaromaticum]|uniref:hypothetical protein n=1 Tax=Carnobacterium maltaromaticum TaxID=2751 RepID=UPI000C7575B6|nr:hypothetical protein [Carnobacterium maltaromaticum]PLS36802.1 hypothetical protein CYV33_04470 [Carnobacterium maltaromaticum]PLS37617.1 hypothetical protein CYV30_04465 [Carnobacterium maltaromaticum]PLS39559.1 hypothetical protein CYV31_02450 [Carnobacterium maltaromaticum]PLS44314.1 hypothetical protein CYV28_04465 [Carnobacterium maltaromaticum]PLS46348.1 hypothetical protein CYV27_04460 [Carnobacterium maltaromaticum]